MRQSGGGELIPGPGELGEKGETEEARREGGACPGGGV